MNYKLYNIVAIVNDGFSDDLMEVVKELGARGGTILQANGSVTTDKARELYGLGIHPEKEIVLILVNESLVKNILEALYTKFGRESGAMGVFFTLPVSHASENLLNQYENKDGNKTKNEK